MAQRNTQATLEWYAGHTNSQTIGFNPNGRCLQVCRTARNIPAMYPSALAAQVATPKANRITTLNAIKRGMVMYFDDPKDSNPYGHIVTVQSRAATVKTLDDIVVWTNSVKSGALVKVRASYFLPHWGDSFQFASNVLNGVPLLLDPAAPKPGPLAGRHGDRMREAIADLKALIEEHERANHPRLVTALKRDLAELRETLGAFD